MADLYTLSVVTAATSDPITATEAKAHLNVDHTDDDTLIGTQITAATKWAENFTGRYFARTILKVKYSAFPTVIYLPSAPVQEVVSITYLDADGVEQTLAADQYELDAEGGRIHKAYGVAWPQTQNHWDAVRVTYGVGYYTASASPIDVTGDIPEDVKGAIKLIVGDLYEHRERQQDIQLYSNDTVAMLLYPYRKYER